MQRTKPEKYLRSEKVRAARPARHGSRGGGVARQVYGRAEKKTEKADIIRRPGKSRERAQDLRQHKQGLESGRCGSDASL